MIILVFGNTCSYDLTKHKRMEKSTRVTVVEKSNRVMAVASGDALFYVFFFFCRNETIFGTCMIPGIGSKALGGVFVSKPPRTYFPFSEWRNGFFL
jgi:hypothetical protein